MFDFVFISAIEKKSAHTQTHTISEGSCENGYYCCACAVCARVCIMQLAIMRCFHMFVFAREPVCARACVSMQVCLHNKAVKSIGFAGFFIKQRPNHSLSALNLTRSMGNLQTWGSIRFANNH